MAERKFFSGRVTQQQGEEVVGHVDVTIEDRQDEDGRIGPIAFLRGLFVNPEKRRGGIGAEILSEAERRAGTDVFQVEVFLDNPAFDLYKRQGYSVVQTLPQPGGQKLLIMQKRRR
jgi:ribosomal protein S18 acetylase RimI-like enzyme